jgi:DNA-binding NtrC family response regulator
MSTPTSGVSARRRILVVDDEVALRSLIARGFRDRGYEVVEVDEAEKLMGRKFVTLPYVLVQPVVIASRTPRESPPPLV